MESNCVYLMCDGAVADAPTKLPITDFANREHFDAEHNVANAIISTEFNTSHFEQTQHKSLSIFTQLLFSIYLQKLDCNVCIC